jgi:MoxR-like ATPase
VETATDIDLSDEVEEGAGAHPVAAAIDPNAARQKLLTIRSELKQILVERDVPIDLVTNSIIARQHGVFVGTGGVAKSMVIDALMERVEAKLFKVMLRKSMPVEEIFGPLSLKGLENDQFRYITKGRAADANVVFLDEIFKANAVVLNAMLMVINERKFINDGVPHDVDLDSVFGASNELPNEPELAAFRDRFAWVNEVKPVQTDDGFKTVLRGALNRTLGQNVPVTKISMDEIRALQMARTKVTVPDDVLNQIATMKRRAEGEFNLFISARRYISGIEMCRAQAVMNNRTNVITDDLALFQHTLWTDIEDAPKAYEVTLDYAGQVARVTQKLRAAFEPHHNALDKLRGEIPTDGSISQEIAGKIASVQMNLKQVGQQVSKQVEEARSDGRDTGELDSLLAEIDADRTYIRNEILN